jgi:hypothetical protein
MATEQLKQQLEATMKAVDAVADDDMKLQLAHSRREVRKELARADPDPLPLNVALNYERELLTTLTMIKKRIERTARDNVVPHKPCVLLSPDGTAQADWSNWAWNLGCLVHQLGKLSAHGDHTGVDQPNDGTAAFAVQLATALGGLGGIHAQLTAADHQPVPHAVTHLGEQVQPLVLQPGNLQALRGDVHPILLALLSENKTITRQSGYGVDATLLAYLEALEGQF